MENQYQNEPWFKFLDHSMQDLAAESYLLLERFEKDPDGFHDYSFIVFPIAKAFEGFLKKWLFANKLISESDYSSDHFRLGKSLNPSLDKKFRKWDYVYDKIVIYSSDPHLADKLWDAWKECRNLLFHYFPSHQHFLATPREARMRIEQLVITMREAMETSINK